MQNTKKYFKQFQKPLDEAARRTAIVAPLKQKFDRLYKLKGYKYPLEQFTVVLDQFTGTEHTKLKQLNILDHMRRHVFVWSIKEWSEMMGRFIALGGFESAVEFRYILKAFRRYLADFEYYRRSPFTGPLQQQAYVGVLGGLIGEYVAKFQADSESTKLISETIERSLPFWTQCYSEFEFSTFVDLVTRLGTLPSSLLAPSSIETLLGHIKNNADYFQSAASKTDLHNVLELNKKFKVLGKEQTEKISRYYKTL